MTRSVYGDHVHIAVMTNRRKLFFVLSLAACSLAACGTSRPAEQPDAQSDPSRDRDGDGVADVVDNCPDVANPVQEDEDADHLGDVCDPCPIDGDATSPDADGDGVGDA